MSVFSAQVKQVIIVESRIGRGADNDPIRPFVEVFELDGTLINTGDYCMEKDHPNGQ